jgi:hypothetical protein
LPYSIIYTVDNLILFLAGGGNALVEKTLAERFFPFMLGPSPQVIVGQVGFKSRELLNESAFRRAPTPKVRMQVLQRDGRRCRICGRRPDDNSDIVLHIHHIRPWEKGGITDPENLITLCHTCHIGLIPHEDHSLFEYLPTTKNDAQKYVQEFLLSVSNYRKAGFFGSFKETSSRQPRRRTRSK